MADSHARAPAKPRPRPAPSRPPPGRQKDPDHVPPSVHDVLRSPGLPLEPGVRAQMESRLGQDFSGVRVHSDPRAATAARALGAGAYTFGHHVGFGAGLYSPHSPAGSAMLAHELVHVVQQTSLGTRGASVPAGVGPVDDACEQEARGAETGRPTTVPAPSPASAAPLVRRGFFSWLGHLFGGTSYDLDELQSYLGGLEKRRGIEDDNDSDNKARAVVERWMSGTPGFQLDGRLKIYLIKEMQSGFTGDDDERAILNLLENSTDADLQEIFSPGGVSVSGLNGDFDGPEWERLKGFYAERFKGGLPALEKGEVKPELGPGARTTAYSWKTLSAMLEGPYETSQIQLYLASTSPAERDRAIVDLSDERVKSGQRLLDAKDARAPADTLEKDGKRLDRIDVVLQSLYRGVAMSQPKDDILKGTVPIKDTSKPEVGPDPAPDPVPKAEKEVNISEALAPKMKPGKKFDPANSAMYEAALVEVLEPRIKSLWNKLVKDKGPAEHADPTKIHPLSEFEAIGKASEIETDLVFGHYRPASPTPGAPAAGSSPGPKKVTYHDRWQKVQDDVAAMDEGQRRTLAKDRVRRLLKSTRAVLAVNRTVDAAPAWTDDGVADNDEARSQVRVMDELTTTADEVNRLIEITRGWEGSADPETGEVWVQLFRDPTETADRQLLWKYFQTLIHEYLHTFMDTDRYYKHARTLPDGEYHTLVEGVDSLLTEVVWTNVVSRMRDPAVAEKIRLAVEGKTFPTARFDPTVIPPISERRYPSYAEALDLANKVGIRNLYAAFFRGHIELLGVKPHE